MNHGEGKEVGMWRVANPLFSYGDKGVNWIFWRVASSLACSGQGQGSGTGGGGEGRKGKERWEEKKLSGEKIENKKK